MKPPLHRTIRRPRRTAGDSGLETWGQRPSGLRASGQRGQALGWVIAIIAAIVVVVLVVLLVQAARESRSVQDQAEQQVQELQTQLRATEARARLNSLKAMVQADVAEETLRSQYDGIRTDLEAAYADAEGAAAETWNELQTGLDQLGESIGQSSEDAVARIDEMLDTLGTRAQEP